MVSLAESTSDYKCVSTDTKPTNVLTNSLMLELDTGKFYYFDGTEWQPVGGE